MKNSYTIVYLLTHDMHGLYDISIYMMLMHSIILYIMFQIYFEKYLFE